MTQVAGTKNLACRREWSVVLTIQKPIRLLKKAADAEAVRGLNLGRSLKSHEK
jgi:hypothetical protein